MVSLEQRAPLTGSATPGEQCRFELTGADKLLKVEFYLKHNGVLYTSPLPSATASLEFRPEAPGAYSLHAHWHQSSSTSGWVGRDFHVDGDCSDASPQVLRLGGNVEAWVPSLWDGALMSRHEENVIRRLQELIKPGSVIYDVGANVGLYALRLARWVGQAGHVYCLEPNPVCVYFLQANVARAKLGNVDILPIALSNRLETLEFTVNYGNSLLGIGKQQLWTKPGHRIHVDADSLDHLLGELDLRPPDLIKLDIEGAERSAVSGMQEVLARKRPILLLELHGRDAARETLDHLDSAGYRFEVITEGRTFQNARELKTWFPDACLQVFGLPPS